MSFMSDLQRSINVYGKYVKYLNIEKQMSPKEYGIAIQGKRKKKKRKGQK